ncbi:YciI family protein [Streptomyces noursei]|uniref:YciI family protein n=1 Tax=Streptomyces noursei TaxID=1971 RepID=UPI0023B7E630|nr:YciI family protein [Streptomyces noursei]
MKWFVVTLASTDEPDPVVGEAQHAFLAGLVERGVLVMSGPFGDGRGGMAVLRCESLEEARELYRNSPVVCSGGATAEIREWHVLLDSTARHQDR